MIVYDVIHDEFPEGGFTIALFKNKEDADRLVKECTAMAKRFAAASIEDDDAWGKLYDDTMFTIPHETCRSDGEFYVREVEIEESYESYMGRERDEER